MDVELLLRKQCSIGNLRREKLVDFWLTIRIISADSVVFRLRNTVNYTWTDVFLRTII